MYTRAKFIKYTDGEGKEFTVPIAAAGNQLMATRLLKLIQEHGSNLEIPTFLVKELLESYQKKSRKLKSAAREIDRLDDENDMLANENDMLFERFRMEYVRDDASAYLPLRCLICPNLFEGCAAAECAVEGRDLSDDDADAVCAACGLCDECAECDDAFVCPCATDGDGCEAYNPVKLLGCSEETAAKFKEATEALQSAFADVAVLYEKMLQEGGLLEDDEFDEDAGAETDANND